jgi:hypothetical protein
MTDYTYNPIDSQMERVLSMNVVPDLIALPTPEIDLTVTYSGSSDPVPGDYLLPFQVCLARPRTSDLSSILTVPSLSIRRLSKNLKST